MKTATFWDEVWQMDSSDTDNISTATLTRWAIIALATLLMAGTGFWMTSISNQIARIEENTGRQISRVEAGLEVIRQAENAAGEKNGAKIVDVQIELKMHALRLEQIEQSVNHRQQQAISDESAARKQGK